MQRPSVPHQSADRMLPAGKSRRLPAARPVLLPLLLRPEVPRHAKQASRRGPQVRFGQVDEALPPQSSGKRPQLRGGRRNDHRVVHLAQAEAEKLQVLQEQVLESCAIN